MKIIKTHWKERNCPVCDCVPYKKLDERKYIIQQRVSKFEIIMQDAVCLNCGLLYERSIPQPEFLNQYYEEAYTRKSDIVDIRPDFNIENRVSVIKKYLDTGSKIIEIGANDGAFLSILKRIGFDASGYDPLMSKDEDTEEVQKLFVSGGEGSLNVAGNQLGDAIVSYFVLEHITEPKKWIAEIVRSLKKNGLVIMEVPNFASFPRESFYYEHFSHFTEFHLRTLFSNCGMEVLYISDDLASRYFGIVIVAQYNGHLSVVDYPKEMVDKTLAKYEENKENFVRIDQVFESISIEVRNKKQDIESTGKKAPIYFWGQTIFPPNLYVFLEIFWTPRKFT